MRSLFYRLSGASLDPSECVRIHQNLSTWILLSILQAGSPLQKEFIARLGLTKLFASFGFPPEVAMS